MLREQFSRALDKIAVEGYKIDSVIPADENIDALYDSAINPAILRRPDPDHRMNRNFQKVIR